MAALLSSGCFSGRLLLHRRREGKEHKLKLNETVQSIVDLNSSTGTESRTLLLVFGALQNVGFSTDQAVDAIEEMQRLGIVFRERS